MFACVPDTVPCFYVYRIQSLVSICTGYSYLFLFVSDTVTFFLYRIGYSTLFLCVHLTAPSTWRFCYLHCVLHYEYLVFKCVWYNTYIYTYMYLGQSLVSIWCLSLHVYVPGTVPRLYIIFGVYTKYIILDVFIPGTLTGLYIYRIKYHVSIYTW